MKDGTPHLAHKAEHAVDLGEDGNGATLAVNLCDAAVGDTATLADTLVAATESLAAARDDERVADKLDSDFVTEVVADKGYRAHLGGGTEDALCCEAKIRAAEFYNLG